jgi:M6 family metalloprotease-like protein
MAALITALVLAASQVGGSDEGTFLGLEPRLEGLQEAGTDYDRYLSPLGEVRAVMLFARFPDSTGDETPEELFELLVPGAVEYFERTSYGRISLGVTPVPRWIEMDAASDSGEYDCSQFETHRHYIREAVRKCDPDVDFSLYDVVYVVAASSPGLPNSPTLHALPGDGIEVDGVELRHGVTFGNDIRNDHWGWRVLVHEMGHVFGLPDLYGYAPASVHEYVGGWDPMGLLTNGSHFLAWHKAKLGWIDEDQVMVLEDGESAEVLVTPIGTSGGTKLVVLPIADDQAYALEVRTRAAVESDEPGVLLYRVRTSVPSGRGPMQVIPARGDDDDPELRRLYARHYNALYTEATVLDDADHRVHVSIREATPDGYLISVTRPAE